MSEPSATAERISRSPKAMSAGRRLRLLYHDLSDPAPHPKTAVIIDYFESLLVIGTIFCGGRFIFIFLVWFDKTFPAKAPPQGLQSLMPVDLGAILITIFDAISMLLALIAGLFSIVNLVIRRSKSLRGR